MPNSRFPASRFSIRSLQALPQYLNAQSRPQIGRQHALNAEYFRRIDALNFTMPHDDGQHADDLEPPMSFLTGISRSSKTPTSIYLANRGIKTANVPIVPSIPVPKLLETDIRSVDRRPDRQRRAHRADPPPSLLALNETKETDYVDHRLITEELVHMRKLCARHNWPIIDVTTALDRGDSRGDHQPPAGARRQG